MIVCCSCLTDCVVAVAANRNNSGYKKQKKGDDEEKFAVINLIFITQILLQTCPCDKVGTTNIIS
jgi:hypothetical protein